MKEIYVVTHRTQGNMVAANKLKDISALIMKSEKDTKELIKFGGFVEYDGFCNCRVEKLKVYWR